MQNVTGIGGIFFKASDPETLMAWYTKHLGITFEHGYFQFKWADDTTPNGSTSLSIFKQNTEYLPVDKQFMINFRVADLPALLAQLRDAGVSIEGEMQEYDYGNFAHIVDPEGNKIELWQPKN